MMPFVLLPAALLQGLLLRRLSRAGMWILLSLIGGVALGATGAAAAYVLPDTLDPAVRTLLPMAVGWAAYALVTGWWLAQGAVVRR